jgi:hypothetical protein
MAISYRSNTLYHPTIQGPAKVYAPTAGRGLVLVADGSNSTRLLSVEYPTGPEALDTLIDGAARLRIQYMNRLYTESVRKYAQPRIAMDDIQPAVVYLPSQSSAPSQLASNAVIYARTNASDKVELVVRWPGGTETVLATET